MKGLLGISSILVVAILAAAQAQAQVLVDESFNHPDGSLIDNTPTPGPGGVWTNHSGTVGDLLVSSGQAVVQHGTPSEDAHTSFADQTAGVITAVFDITVNDDTVIGQRSDRKSVV